MTGTNKIKTNQRCGNPNCGVTTNIADEISCGTGKLDDYGFWEFPCEKCTKWLRETLKEDENDRNKNR